MFAITLTKDDWSKSNWYIETNLYLIQIALHFDLPIEKVIGITSALSPRCTWKQNVIDTYRFIKYGGKYKPTTYSPQVRKAREIIKLKPKHFDRIPEILHGPKTRAFYQALLHPTQYNTPVIDTHMIRAYLNAPALSTENKFIKYYLREKNMVIIASAIESLAIKYGVNVHSMQAVLWTAWKRITDNKIFSNSLPIWNSLVNAPCQQQKLFQ